MFSNWTLVPTSFGVTDWCQRLCCERFAIEAWTSTVDRFFEIVLQHSFDKKLRARKFFFYIWFDCMFTIIRVCMFRVVKHGPCFLAACLWLAGRSPSVTVELLLCRTVVCVPLPSAPCGLPARALCVRWLVLWVAGLWLVTLGCFLGWYRLGVYQHGGLNRSTVPPSLQTI